MLICDRSIIFLETYTFTIPPSSQITEAIKVDGTVFAFFGEINHGASLVKTVVLSLK